MSHAVSRKDLLRFAVASVVAPCALPACSEDAGTTRGSGGTSGGSTGKGGSGGSATGGTTAGGSGGSAGGTGGSSGGGGASGGSAGSAGKGGSAGSGGGGSGGTSGSGGSTANSCSADAVAEISCPHDPPHELTVPMADIVAGVMQSYDIEGQSDHSHVITLSAADFATLRAGGTVHKFVEANQYQDHCVTLSCATATDPVASGQCNGGNAFVCD